MGDIKQKECCRPKFKTLKRSFKGTKKQEIWHTNSENLEILAIKRMKLVAFF